MVHKQAWSIKNYRYVWDLSMVKTLQNFIKFEHWLFVNRGSSLASYGWIWKSKGHLLCNDVNLIYSEKYTINWSNVCVMVGSYAPRANMHAARSRQDGSNPLPRYRHGVDRHQTCNSVAFWRDRKQCSSAWGSMRFVYSRGSCRAT
jgi:hypothetical protein